MTSMEENGKRGKNEGIANIRSWRDPNRVIKINSDKLDEGHNYQGENYSESHS